MFLVLFLMIFIRLRYLILSPPRIGRWRLEFPSRIGTFISILHFFSFQVFQAVVSFSLLGHWGSLGIKLPLLSHGQEL